MNGNIAAIDPSQDPIMQKALAMSPAVSTGAPNVDPANDPVMQKALAMTPAASMPGVPNQQQQQAVQAQQFPGNTPINNAINQAIPGIQSIPLVGNTAADMLRGAQVTGFNGIPMPYSLMQGVGQGIQAAASGAVNLYNKLPTSLQGIPGLPFTRGNLPNVPNPQALQNPISPATAFVGNMASSALMPGDIGFASKAAGMGANLGPRAAGVVNALAPMADRAVMGAGYGALYGSANGNNPTAGNIALSAALPAAAPYAVQGAQSLLNGNALKAVARPIVSGLTGMMQNRGLSRGSPLLNPSDVPARNAAIGQSPVSLGEFTGSPSLTGTYNNSSQLPLSGQAPVMQAKLQDVKDSANGLMSGLLGNADPTQINPTILNDLQQNAADVKAQVKGKYNLASQIAQQSGLDTTATPTAQSIAQQALSDAALARQKNQVHWLNGSDSGIDLVKKIAAGPNPTTILNKSALPEDLAQYQSMQNVSTQQTGTKILSTNAAPEDLNKYSNLQNVSIVPTGTKTLNEDASWQDLPQYQGVKNVSIQENPAPPSFGIGPQIPRYSVTQPLHTVSQPTYTVTRAIPSNLNDAIQTRSSIGEIQREASKNGQNAKASLFGNIHAGMTADLNNNIAATNHPTLQAAWQDANDTYRDQQVPYEQAAIRGLLSKEDTTDLTAPLMKPENASVLANLPQPTKNLVAYQELNKSLGLNNGKPEAVASKLANNYARLETQSPGTVDRMLDPQTQQSFSNFHTLYNATKNAVPFVYPPATGFHMRKIFSQGLPYALAAAGGAAGLIHPALALTGAAMPAAMLGLNRGMSKVMTNPALRQAYGAVTQDANGKIIPNALARRQFVNQALPYKPGTPTSALNRFNPMIANALSQGNQTQ